MNANSEVMGIVTNLCSNLKELDKLGFFLAAASVDLAIAQTRHQAGITSDLDLKQLSNRVDFSKLDAMITLSENTNCTVVRLGIP